MSQLSDSDRTSAYYQTMTRCSQCLRDGANFQTISSRHLCDECRLQYAQFVGAGSAMVDGQDVMTAVGVGLATGRWAGSIEAELEASRRRKAKLDATTGFWRRLWVRVIG